MAVEANNGKTIIILIESSKDTTTDIQNELKNIPDAIYETSERQNLDGAIPLWITIANLSLQALPHLLNFLVSLKRPKLPTKIKVGDIEIENPAEEDMERLRQLYIK